MDCEKFESLLIDELYGELDEVTSAAVRRHAAGCARCGALLSGLRATRKVAALPPEEPSADLEDRILSAVREQQKVIPFRVKMATVVSRAGAWAMRPQTAMAAVFLLVIGTSFVFMQSRKADAPEGAMRVQAAGAPAAKASPTSMASAIALDGLEAQRAHGVEDTPGRGGETRAASEAVASAAPGDMSSLARDKDGEKEKKAEGKLALADESPYELRNAGPMGGAPPPAAAPQTVTGSFGGASAGGGGGGGGGYVQGHGNAPVQAQQPSAPGGVGFSEAMQSYSQGRYDDATKKFDALSPTDANAALWAARATRDGHGCAAAIQRFEAVRGRNAGQPSNEATLDAGRCYRAMGDSGNARARFSQLLPNQAYATRAQEELDAMTPVAAKRSAHEAPKPAATTTTTPRATTDTGL